MCKLRYEHAYYRCDATASLEQTYPRVYSEGRLRATGRFIDVHLVFMWVQMDVLALHRFMVMDPTRGLAYPTCGLSALPYSLPNVTTSYLTTRMRNYYTEACNRGRNVN